MDHPRLQRGVGQEPGQGQRDDAQDTPRPGTDAGQQRATRGVQTDRRALKYCRADDGKEHEPAHRGNNQRQRQQPQADVEDGREPARASERPRRGQADRERQRQLVGHPPDRAELGDLAAVYRHRLRGTHRRQHDAPAERRRENASSASNSAPNANIVNRSGRSTIRRWSAKSAIIHSRWKCAPSRIRPAKWTNSSNTDVQPTAVNTLSPFHPATRYTPHTTVWNTGYCW